MQSNNRRQSVGIALVAIAYVGLYVPLKILAEALIYFAGFFASLSLFLFEFQLVFVFVMMLAICGSIAKFYRFNPAPKVWPIRSEDLGAMLGLAVAAVFVRHFGFWASGGSTTYTLIAYDPSRERDVFYLLGTRFWWEYIWHPFFVSLIVCRFILAPALEHGVKPALVAAIPIALWLVMSLLNVLWWPESGKASLLSTAHIIQLLQQGVIAGLIGVVYVKNQKWTTILAGLLLAAALAHVLPNAYLG